VSKPLDKAAGNKAL